MSDPLSSSHQHPPPAHTSHPDPKFAESTSDPAAIATASHPPASAPDPTTASSSSSHPNINPPQGASASSLHDNAAQGGLTTTAPSGPAQLASLKVKLQNGLRQFPDFPEPGILFEDIMPLFANHELHSDLIAALELQIAERFGVKTGQKSEIDVVVGLESRGFLFGPTLALRLGAGFVPVRKKGKLPGECVTETYQKEYGEDVFQMQSDAIKPGQKVVIVDDIIATGGTAQAAGNLVQKLGGHLLGYVFMMELDFLKGRDKLNAPVHTLFGGQAK
ncbi:adenine phosphoribosyltransferase-like [Lecanosticta acicola]|uniref:adenine phosphoribosyltransferase n=1 Tax=Lecanosticta acicola TaxID=111012 RepID=A0AAI8Z722_9PEZI|nr:adenine phosphoribosyltransferase-like [Lecanosticta acicola]